MILSIAPFFAIPLFFACNVLICLHSNLLIMYYRFDVNLIILKTEKVTSVGAETNVHNSQEAIIDIKI